MKDTRQIQRLVTTIAKWFTTHPEKIALKTVEAPGRAPETPRTTWFIMNCDPEDEAKLVGRSGSHVYAFSYLVHRAGRAEGEAWRFHLDTKTPPGSGARSQNHAELPPASSYAFEPVKELLTAAIELMDVEEFGIELETIPGAAAEPTVGIFSILVRSRRDYEALTVPDVGAPGPLFNMTVVGALGTLFRAIARWDRVGLQLRVVEPRNKTHDDRKSDTPNAGGSLR